MRMRASLTIHPSVEGKDGIEGEVDEDSANDRKGHLDTPDEAALRVQVEADAVANAQVVEGKIVDGAIHATGVDEQVRRDHASEVPRVFGRAERGDAVAEAIERIATQALLAAEARQVGERN